MHATVLLFLMICLFAPPRCSAIDFSFSELPWAVVDQPYTPPPLMAYGVARCPAGDLTFTAIDQLPPGLSLTALGQITGVPGKTGVYSFQVRASDTCGAASTRVTIVVTGAPILVVQADSLEFHYRRGGALPALQALLVNGTWPGLPYSVDRPEAPWLRATARSGRTPKRGAAVEADRVEVSVDPDKLAPGRYDATLRFWTWQGANVPTVSVRLVIE